MDIVLDTVCVNHLAKTGGQDNVVSKHVSRRRLRLVLDKKLALLDEWSKTANNEVVRMLFVHWSDQNGIVKLKTDAKLPGPAKKKLAELGFTDTGDKLVVAICLNTTDRIIVTLDSDFWDPKNKNSRKTHSGPVADYLADEFNIDVLPLVQLDAKCNI